VTPCGANDLLASAWHPCFDGHVIAALRQLVEMASDEKEVHW
jgi:hypothetical protein